MNDIDPTREQLIDAIRLAAAVVIDARHFTVSLDKWYPGLADLRAKISRALRDPVIDATIYDLAVETVPASIRPTLPPTFAELVEDAR